MSQENVEIAVDYFAAVDLAAGAASLSDDVTFAFHGEARHLSGAETLTGKAQAVAWLADWFSRFERDYRFEIDEALDMGDRVLVVTTHRGRGRASGVPVSQQTTQVVAIREGKIVRQDFYANRAEALETSGLQP